MSIWDQFTTSSDYVKFDNPGDSVAGKVLELTTHSFDDGNIVPKFVIVTDSGDTVTMTAGQVQLKSKLREARPEVGDHLTVIYVRSEKRAGGKTLKHFDVKVIKGEADDLI